jgi:hypothetical protein
MPVNSRLSMARKRIDRFIEEALLAFTEWYIDADDWYGKERDCVNRFAHGFLGKDVGSNAAIKNVEQIRIECAVPQPRVAGKKRYSRIAACKDIVIWRDALSTAWSRDWMPVNFPWVVMEWKTFRKGTPRGEYDAHDIEWLELFTAEKPVSYGYLVQVYAGEKAKRGVSWAKVARGRVQQTNRRS